MMALDPTPVPADDPEEEERPLDCGESGGTDLDVRKDPGVRSIGESGNALDGERTGRGRRNRCQRGLLPLPRMRRRVGEQDVGAVLAAQPAHRPALPPGMVGRAKQLHQAAAVGVDLAGTCAALKFTSLAATRSCSWWAISDRRLQQVGARPTLGVGVRVDRRLDHPETRQGGQRNGVGASNARPNRLGERVNMCRMAPIGLSSGSGEEASPYRGSSESALYRSLIEDGSQRSASRPSLSSRPAAPSRSSRFAFSQRSGRSRTSRTKRLPGSSRHVHCPR